MKNLRMKEMIARGSAIDLKDCVRVECPDWDGYCYLIEDKFALNCLANDVAKDFCDSSTEAWMWSIGKRDHDGKVFASTSGVFYQKPGYECVWLR